jgi:hypothetical protein
MGMLNFSSQARLEILAEVHRLAAAEDKKLEDVLDEALTDWVQKEGGDARRPEVSAHRRASVARRRKLHEELAHWANISRL